MELVSSNEDSLMVKTLHIFN